MADHSFGIVRHERVHSYGHWTSLIQADIQSVTLITIYGYRGMLVCVARSIPTVIPKVINVYLTRFSRS